jgi:uncharacterized protein involved in outer membrane biogenesis
MMLRFQKSRTYVILGVLAALVAVYAVAGFWVAPKLLRSALLEDIPKSIGVKPTVGEIRINPFLFQLTLNDFSLAGAGGERLVGFKRLFVDFELSSLWHRAYSFANIDLTAPYVGAAVAKDGSLNLMQLKPPAAPAAPPPQEKSATLPNLRIGSFKVSQGVANYEDRSQPDLFTARLEPINFELRDFTTGVEGGRFTFTGSSRLGERLEWHGHLSVQPLESDGEFRIDGLLAHTLWEYLQDRVNFVVNSGSIDLAATYRFSAAPAAAGGVPGAAALHVELPTVALKDLAVLPRDSQAEWIAIPNLTVSGTTVDLGSQHAHVDLVSLTGVKLLTWLEPDGSLNLKQLTVAPAVARASGAGASAPAAAAATTPTAGAASPASDSASAPAPTAAGESPAAPVAPWTYDLRQLELRDAGIAFEDRTTHPTVKLSLAPLSLTVNGASQDLARPVSVQFETRINAAGSLAVTGDVTPQPASADLALKMSGLDLTVLQPYIAQRSSMTLLGGVLGVDAKLHYGAAKSTPAVRFAGRIDIDKLHTVDDALHDDFINWDNLDIAGLTYTQGPDRLDIDQITVRKPYARVIIEPDETLNAKRVLAVPGAAPAPAPTAAGKATDATPHDAKAARAAAPPPGAAPASGGMPTSIRKILIQSGQAMFADLSVTPNFSTGIQSLGGTITGLSSRPGSRATMDLHGSVDAYSPVAITGQLNVLGPTLYTDVSLSFRNISLPIFNPYSGKFAGYNITKGKLSTELHYKVDGRKLDAQHHVVVEQLEFGDKTASKEAVSLPVKLAVSLLKDRNGVIDLSLPVQGSLDDPQFRLAPLIWKVFLNILEKAVTAPFALLGSLFGGGPDIQYIDFEAGLSTLDDAATDKLKAVARALNERPQLKIEVPIAVVPELDRPALVAAKFRAEVGAQQAATGRPRASAAGAERRAFAELDPQSQLDLLSALYAKDFGAPPKFPDAVTSVKAKPELIAAKIEFVSTAIRAHITVADADLQALGQQRALGLQQTLLQDTQLDPERVFLAGNDKATAKDGSVRLELTLQ